MSAFQAFNPAYGSGLTITPTAASAAVSLKSRNKQLRVLNTGAAIGYFRTYKLSNGATPATAFDMPVPAGMATTVTIFEDHDTIATISATGTTFSVIQGEGL